MTPIHNLLANMGLVEPVVLWVWKGKIYVIPPESARLGCIAELDDTKGIRAELEREWVGAVCYANCPPPATKGVKV